MSLDVYLYAESEPEAQVCGECGRPLDDDADEGPLFEANITHNLNKMAQEAGIYYELWRPDEIGAIHAGDIIKPLEAGLDKLKSNPPRFEAFKPPNGWGSYKHFVPWVEAYLEACKENPRAFIRASR